MALGHQLHLFFNVHVRCRKYRRCKLNCKPPSNNTMTLLLHNQYAIDDY